MVHARQRGFSSVQLLAALTVVAMLLLIAVPAFRTITRRSRVTSAARQVIADLREARGRAVGSGWECKIIGFAATSTDVRRNQYRLLARRTSSTSWPADTSPRLSTTTQLAEDWTDVARLYPGVNLVSPTARFEIAFDARGTAPGAASFNPLVVNNTAGDTKSITVTTVGGVRAQ